MASDFFAPIDSVYLAGALIKTTVQVVLLWLLSYCITLAARLPRNNTLLAAAMLAPLFQTMGYNKYMGVIDLSITYTFFYALPLTVLLLFFIPFFRALNEPENFRITVVQGILLAALAIILPLMGPLVPAVVVLICPVMVLFVMVKTEKLNFADKLRYGLKTIPRSVWFFLLLIGLVSLYSLYIGTFNTENAASPVALAERYSRLLPGLFVQLSRKLGYPVLLLLLIVNVVLLRKQGDKAKPVLRLMLWIGVVSLLYLLLLPLGGYREYRPLIIRRDTFLPVTLAMFFCFGVSTLYLLRKASFKNQRFYLGLIVVALALFAFSDQPAFEFYNCERQALEQIAQAKTPEVKLEGNCKVMSWEVIRNPNDADLNAQLLQFWNITNEKKRYYFSE